MKKYKIIGLTGQSGAGKSTVAKYFKDYGCKVINADLLVSQLYEGNSPCVKTISACFGSDIISADGVLNRKLLAQRAFSSKENTALLGSIVHPFVIALFFSELKKCGESDMVVYDAPQLFESNSDAICDYVISVVADRAKRIERICQRDKITEEQALLRINAQLSEQFFKDNSDFVIENNGSTCDLKIHIDSVFDFFNAN